MHPSGTRFALSAICAGVCAVTLIGCGSSSSSGSKAEEKKTAQQVLADGKSGLFNAKAVHVAGSLSAQGQSQDIDLQFQGEDTAGTVTLTGAKVQIVKTKGLVFIKAPAAFWTKVAGSKATVLANKWIKVDAKQAGSLSTLTLQGVAASLNAADSPLDPKTTIAQAGGQKAIVVSQKDGSQLFLTDSATPVPLKVVSGGATKGTINFTDYGKAQNISEPAGALTPQEAAKTGAVNA